MCDMLWGGGRENAHACKPHPQESSSTQLPPSRSLPPPQAHSAHPSRLCSHCDWCPLISRGHSLLTFGGFPDVSPASLAPGTNPVPFYLHPQYSLSREFIHSYQQMFTQCLLHARPARYWQLSSYGHSFMEKQSGVGVGRAQHSS